MGPSEAGWVPDQGLMGLLLAVGTHKSRDNGAHLETMGPVVIDGAKNQDKKPRAGEDPVQRANWPF